MSLINHLPYDGEVYYHSPAFTPTEADHYLAHLLQDIAWEHDQAVMFGKTLVTRRKVAWYGDQAFPYTYSRITRTALPWTPVLQQLKARAEHLSNATFNACLLNLYHDGSEGMGWHRDAERELQPGGVIASLSFGAERRFSLKHRTQDVRVHQVLAHGSLLIMQGETQQHWLHQLPTTKKIKTPRVNLTFRQMR